MRGDLYLKQGIHDKAVDDYFQVLRITTNEFSVSVGGTSAQIEPWQIENAQERIAELTRSIRESPPVGSAPHVEHALNAMYFSANTQRQSLTIPQGID